MRSHQTPEISTRAYVPVMDLVLTGLWMDALGGHGFTQKIKGDPELAHLSVLVMTTDTTAESRQRLMQAGALRILNKPFSPQQLINAVNRAVDVRWSSEQFASERSRSSA